MAYFFAPHDIFLSTLSLRRATAFRRTGAYIHNISIHALLAESDGVDIENINYWTISIHALLAESDFSLCGPCGHLPQFLSTLSLRRATYNVIFKISPLSNFYPRSPCGERPGQVEEGNPVQYISIHALLAESDACDGWL